MELSTQNSTPPQVPLYPPGAFNMLPPIYNVPQPGESRDTGTLQNPIPLTLPIALHKVLSMRASNHRMPPRDLSVLRNDRRMPLVEKRNNGRCLHPDHRIARKPLPSTLASRPTNTISNRPPPPAGQFLIAAPPPQSTTSSVMLIAPSPDYYGPDTSIQYLPVWVGARPTLPDTSNWSATGAGGVMRTAESSPRSVSCGGCIGCWRARQYRYVQGGLPAPCHGTQIAGAAGYPHALSGLGPWTGRSQLDEGSVAPLNWPAVSEVLNA